MDSTFDPDTFMQQTVDGPMSTEITKCPEGEFQFMIDDFDAKAFRIIEWPDKNTGDQREGLIFECPCLCMDDGVKQQLGRDRVTVPVKMFIDRTPDGKLDWGKDKNVKLGRLREAVNQNGAGPWQTLQLRGAGPFIGRVAHVADKKDPSITRAEIVRTTRIGG